MNAFSLRAYARRAAAANGDSPLRSRRFVQMLCARFTSALAVNALHYALLIAVVQQTGSALHSSLLVLTFTVPGVLVGMFAGVAADQLSRRLILIGVHILRAVACVAFFRLAGDVWALYGISLLFSAVNSFAGPAEYAVLPGLVGTKRLTSGNAWFNLTALAGQAIGLGVLAPVSLKTVGPEPVYILGAVLYGMAALLVLQMGRLSRAARPSHERRTTRVAGARAQLRQVWDFLRSDRPAYLATVEMTAAMALVLVTVSVMPAYVHDVIGMPPEDAVFVFAPAVIGMAAGLRLVTPLSARIGKGAVVAAGFALLVAGSLALGFIEPLAALFTSWQIGPGGVSFGPSAITIMAMAIAVPVGFSYTAVAVAARAVLHERAPDRLHGRVFAAQGVLSSLASVVLLLAGGATAQLLGVRSALILVGLTAAAVAMYARLGERADPRQPVTAATG